MDAIQLFGKSNTKNNIILEKSYKEYLEGFSDILTNNACRGYLDVVEELNERFPNVEKIVMEKDKRDFAKLFGEYLKIENILQNYDEFTALKAFQKVDYNDEQQLEKFKKDYFVND
nr:hypothetical protein [Oceanotoga sp.]